MNENSSHQNRGPQRRGQRGGRRRNDSRGPRNNSGESRQGKDRSPYGGRDQRQKPLTLWQKIVGFFTGKAKAPAAIENTADQPRSVHPAHRGATNSGRPSDSYRRLENPPTGNESRAEDPAPREERVREPRKAEILEVTTPRLYVGNLSFDATESDLADLFNGVGKVRNAEVVSNNYTQKSKGFAFVTMETVDEAKRAVTELHDKEFMNRKLIVSGAKPNDRPFA